MNCAYHTFQGKSYHKSSWDLIPSNLALRKFEETTFTNLVILVMLT